MEEGTTRKNGQIWETMHKFFSRSPDFLFGVCPESAARLVLALSFVACLACILLFLGWRLQLIL